MVSTAPNSEAPRPVAPIVEKPRPPPPAVAAEEAQWLFSEEELLMTPSIVDGMSPEEEKTLRRKGVSFILQVGMMLKLPQTTLSTAAIFFNRYLMRCSLKATPGYKPLHHYQVAATALFLATKNEETCRKLKELVVACVRVALKDPNKLVDEQTKDFWKWRDTILYSEDLILEALCFDLAVTPPYKAMYDMMVYHGLHHNKDLRNATWAFLSDSDSTRICLLFNTRTIAAAAVYAGAKLSGTEIPPDQDGRPWWEVQYVKLHDIRRAIVHMADLYAQSPEKEGESNMYQTLRESPDFSPNLGQQTPGSARHGEASQSQSQPQSQSQQSPVDTAKDGEDVAMGNHDTRGTGPAANGTAAAPPGENDAAADQADDNGSEEGELSG